MSDPAAARREDARRRVELEASAARAEAEVAQRIIDEFLVEVRRRGIPPEPLVATLLNGRTAKTDKTGWYVNRRQSLAIGEDGSYYVLVVASSPMARFTGVRLEPSPPTIEVSKGGRDGESGPLKEFLDRVLEQ